MFIVSLNMTFINLDRLHLVTLNIAFIHQIVHCGYKITQIRIYTDIIIKSRTQVQHISFISVLVNSFYGRIRLKELKELNIALPIMIYSPLS